jgi:hypothetical protein
MKATPVLNVFSFFSLAILGTIVLLFVIPPGHQPPSMARGQKR